MNKKRRKGSTVAVSTKDMQEFGRIPSLDNRESLVAARALGLFPQGERSNRNVLDEA